MRRESQERASQQSGVGTPDMGASDQFSSSGKEQRDEVAPETPERADDSAAPREGTSERDAVGRDGERVGGTPDLAEDNIVPEGLRSER